MLFGQESSPTIFVNKSVLLAQSFGPSRERLSSSGAATIHGARFLRRCIIDTQHPEIRLFRERDRTKTIARKWLVILVQKIKRKYRQKKKTCNTRDSLVVTDQTTNLALTGLSREEQTGFRVLLWVWSHVLVLFPSTPYEG